MEKHYKVIVDELSFGGLEKEIGNYKDAREYYKLINSRLNKVPCKVTLKGIEQDSETGEIIETIQYIDMPGKTIALESKLQQVKKLLSEISDLEKEFKEIELNDNDLFFDLRHAIEQGLAINITEAESKAIIDNLHLESLVRRGAKKELKKHTYCRASLAALNININKAISDCEKLKKEQAICAKKQSAIDANIKYEKTLDYLRK